MSRYRRQLRVLSIMVIWLMAPAGSVRAAEVNGVVAAVQDKTVTANLPAGAAAAVGDKATVFVEIPGVGKATVGTGRVTAVDGGRVTAVIDNATGRIVVGQQVTFQTAGSSPAAAAPQDEPAMWGTPVNPDGDCKIIVAGGKATITVPGVKHDLSMDGQEPESRYNAPRLLQAVEGDFVVQVKLTADWTLGTSLPGGQNTIAAGLAVWDSPQQYLRHERILFHHRTLGTINTFVPPIYDHNQKRLSKIELAEPDFFPAGPTWLRLERKGRVLTTAISRDGQQWTATNSVETEFPAHVQVGVHVINASAREFTAVFEDFQLTQSSAVAKNELAKWGTPVNPDGDCTFRAENGKLTITVPDGLHDLWPGRPVPSQSFNAPRVLQAVTGDFVMQVKVSADWKPYQTDTNYGAGLVVWDSETSLLRRERHVFMLNGQPQCFSTPLYLRDGKRLDDRKLETADYYQGRSTWLRVERRGQDVTTSISHDGKSWIDTGTLATGFPPTVRVGVHAFKVSPGTFKAEFEDFSLRTSGDGTKTSAAAGSLPDMPKLKPAGVWMAVQFVEFRGRMIVAGQLADGPGGKAGLRINDELVTFDGDACKNLPEILRVNERHQAGDVVPLVYRRRGREEKVDVVLEAQPSDEGFARFKAAAEAGDAWAMMQYGLKLSGWKRHGQPMTEPQQAEQMVSWVRRADEAGCLPATHLLAEWHYQGLTNGSRQIVEQDRAKAAALLQRIRSTAADGRSDVFFINATNEYADFMLEGTGIPQDVAGAARLAESLGDDVNSLLAHTIGEAYRDGKGVAKDVQKALAWFQKTTDGSGLASIGIMVYDGNGFQKDFKTARGWFEAGAEKDNAVAMLYLGFMNERGEAGPVNLTQAWQWYDKTCRTAMSKSLIGLAEYQAGRFLERHGREIGHDASEALRLAITRYRRGAVYSDDAKQALERLGVPLTEPPTAPAPPPPNTARHIAGWGAVVDPDGDCRISAEGDRLTITLPAGLHDMWYGRLEPEKRYNAPRILQTVTGDFTAQVKVTAPLEGPADDNGQFSRAAGLFIYESDSHYLRHERNRFISDRQPGVGWSWMPPLYDREGQRISTWHSSKDGPFHGGSTWLRMERSGQIVTTWMSHDGNQWIETGRHETTFAPTVQVGILAHGRSSQPTTFLFEEFSRTQK